MAGLMYKGLFKQEETAAMRIGSMFHLILLEADKYVDKYIVSDFEKPKSPQMESFLDEVIKLKINGLSIDSSADKIYELYSLSYKRPISKKDSATNEAYDAIKSNMAYINAKVEALSQKKEIVPEIEHNMVCRMVESVFSNRAAKSLLESRDSKFIEQPLLFKSAQGIQCKAKPDLFIVNEESEEITLVDIKTCKENVLGGFVSEFYKRKYYRQLAFYNEAIKMNGYDSYDIYHKIIVVNKEENIYDSAVYNINAHDIQRGKQEAYDLLTQITYSIINDCWDFPVNYYTGNGAYDMPSKFEKQNYV